MYREKSLMAIFSCITVTFFLCHLPRVVLNIYEFQLQRNSAICREVKIKKKLPKLLPSDVAIFSSASWDKVRSSSVVFHHDLCRKNPSHPQRVRQLSLLLLLRPRVQKPLLPHPALRPLPRPISVPGRGHEMRLDQSESCGLRVGPDGPEHAAGRGQFAGHPGGAGFSGPGLQLAELGTVDQSKSA